MIAFFTGRSGNIGSIFKFKLVKKDCIGKVSVARLSKNLDPAKHLLVFIRRTYGFFKWIYDEKTRTRLLKLFQVV